MSTCTEKTKKKNKKKIAEYEDKIDKANEETAKVVGQRPRQEQLAKAC
jgi:hypothetical protein